LKEYKNRQKNPQYAKIHICNNLHRESMHTDVSNIENTETDGVRWLEFDSVVNDKKLHCRIRGGYVSEYHEYVDE
jgi:hypothetical protein